MTHWVNYHGHCNFCDGQESPEAYVKKAIEESFPIYGFSSHSPVPFESKWNMKRENATHYVQEINRLKQQYQGQIELYCGMEVDYLPGEMGPNHPDIIALKLDYTIGSVHYAAKFKDGNPWEIDGAHPLFLKGVNEIFDNNIQAAISQYFRMTRAMITTDMPDILGHMDKIKIQNENGLLFSDTEKWYREEVEETLSIIKQRQLIVEVNTRGIYKKRTIETYPSPWILRRMQEMQIPVTLSSDAHHPTEISSEFENTAGLLKSLGFKTLKILHNKNWEEVSFDENGIIFR